MSLVFFANFAYSAALRESDALPALKSASSRLQRLHRKQAPGENEPGQARAGEFAWGLAVVKLAVLP
jgi:hypothetical protein